MLPRAFHMSHRINSNIYVAVSPGEASLEDHASLTIDNPGADGKSMCVIYEASFFQKNFSLKFFFIVNL